MKSSLKVVWNSKMTFFIEQNIAFLFKTYFFKIPKNLIASAFFFFFFFFFFFLEADTKKYRLPRQKPRMLHWWNNLIESFQMTMWLIARCFSVNDKHGQQTFLFDSPQHCFLSFGWRLQIRSLYYQILL